MDNSAAVRPRIDEDPVSNVLKWILLAGCDREFRPVCLGDGADLRTRRAATGPLRHDRRRNGHDRRRHRRRQGRISESRPDGLREPVRDGLLFRPGLYGVRAGASGRADRGKSRPGPFRGGIRQPVGRAAGRYPRHHAAAASGGRSHPAGSHDPRRSGRRHRDLAAAILPKAFIRSISRPAGPRPTA